MCAKVYIYIYIYLCIYEDKEKKSSRQWNWFVEAINETDRKTDRQTEGEAAKAEIRIYRSLVRLINTLTKLRLKKADKMKRRPPAP